MKKTSYTRENVQNEVSKALHDHKAKRANYTRGGVDNNFVKRLGCKSYTLSYHKC